MSRKVTGKMHMEEVGHVSISIHGTDKISITFRSTNNDGTETELTVYVHRWYLPEMLKQMQDATREWLRIFTNLAKTFGVS